MATVRAALTLASGRTVVAYIPESAAGELPMYPRFRAAVLAQLRPQQDAYESSTLALRVLAIARFVPLTDG